MPVREWKCQQLHLYRRRILCTCCAITAVYRTTERMMQHSAPARDIVAVNYYPLNLCRCDLVWHELKTNNQIKITFFSLLFHPIYVNAQFNMSSIDLTSFLWKRRKNYLRTTSSTSHFATYSDAEISSRPTSDARTFHRDLQFEEPQVVCRCDGWPSMFSLVVHWIQNVPLSLSL